MSSKLEQCPNEVIESICGYLNLPDICSLRMSSRSLATKATQTHFKSYFLVKHVDITVRDLQEFVALTQPGQLGCLIENLVLVGVVNNTKFLERKLEDDSYSDYVEMDDEDIVGNVDEDANEDTGEVQEVQKKESSIQIRRDLEILRRRHVDHDSMRSSGEDVTLLSEACRNIMKNTKTGKLMSLTLEVVIYRKNSWQRLLPVAGGSWKYIWKSTAESFQTMIQSLGSSELPIEKLNIFNGHNLQRCSLSCYDLGITDYTNDGLAKSLSSVKVLSISISDRFVPRHPVEMVISYDEAEKYDSMLYHQKRNIDDIRAEARDEANFNGLAKILSLTTSLEELELHQYNLHQGRGDYSKLLRRASELPLRLERLELRGACIEAKDFLVFIQMSNLQRLFLYDVVLHSGLYKDLFEYCNGDASSIRELYCHMLIEIPTAVYFEGPGESLFWPMDVNGSLGSDTLHRIGIEVKQKIAYVSGLSHPMITPRLNRYRRQQHIEYGPPGR